MQLFVLPVVCSLLAFVAVYWWGGVGALVLALALSALEISLSFDNAVLNAKILERMSSLWQRRFLTWGMVVAVFGIRFLLPVFIVAIAATASPLAIAMLALQDPKAYAELLGGADAAIHAFGGAFLLMVALKYFFDEQKDVHWFENIERRFVLWGRVWAIETIIALLALVAVSLVSGEHWHVFIAGVVGVVLYLALERTTNMLTSGIKQAGAVGAALFIYLNVLDAAFSLDGVIGAFAITTDILIILVGLGIGAYFVRTMTIYLTRQGTIRRFIYLEHGAHWAIFSLAICLFAALFTHVPEAVPGGVGLVFAILAFYSSRKVLAQSS